MQGLEEAMKRAFNFYRGNPESWDKLVQKDMKLDFSWKSSAQKFEELYRKAVARARNTHA